MTYRLDAVLTCDIVHAAVSHNRTLPQKNGSVAILAKDADVVRGQCQDAGTVYNVFDALTCFRGKIHVADPDQLVEKQDVMMAHC